MSAIQVTALFISSIVMFNIVMLLALWWREHRRQALQIAGTEFSDHYQKLLHDTGAPMPDPLAIKTQRALSTTSFVWQAGAAAAQLMPAQSLDQCEKNIQDNLALAHRQGLIHYADQLEATLRDFRAQRQAQRS